MFKIYFDSSPEKNSILGITYDTIFTVFITIAIFILGYIITKILENSKENKRLNEVEDYFKKLISILEKPITLQINSLITLSKLLKDKKEQHYIIDNVSSLKLNQIHNIDKNDLYKIYIRNKRGDIQIKTDLYCKIIFSIDFIDDVKTNYEKSFFDFINRQQIETQNYRTNIKELDTLLNNYITLNIQNSIMPKNDIFLREILDVKHSWIQMKDYTDMFNAMPNFIEPIRNICKVHGHDQRANMLLKHVMECVYSFKNIVELKSVNRRLFLLDARGIQTSLYKIKFALAEFDKL